MGTFRRRGPRRAIALLTTLALAAAACGGDDDDDAGAQETSAAGTSASGAPDATAAPGATDGPAATTGTAGTAASVPDDSELDLDATLTVTTDGPPTLLDPHQEPTQGVTPYWTPLYDTLTDITISGEVNPRLATDWEFSEDGLSLVLQIRDGVTFHDGSALDAEGVKANIDRARSAEESTQKNLLAHVTDVQATGPLEVTLTLDAYDAALPSILGTAAGAIVNPAAIASGADLDVESAGTGAYVFTEFVPDQRVTYVRAEDPNWDPAAGKLAGFTLEVLTDYQVALNGLQAGQYDLVRLNGLGQQVAQATQGGDLTQTEIGPLQTLAFWLNNQDPAFADHRVRQAFAYALDRDGIVNAVFDQGSECSAASQMYPFPGDGLEVEGYDPYHYDPEKAKQLLAEAGAEGTKLLITDIGATNTGNLMQAAQPMLEAAGFEVELARGTGAAVAPGFQKGEYQVAVIPHAKQAHPIITLNRYWLTGGPYHLAQGEDTGLLETLGSISDPTLSEDEVAAGYQDIAEQLAELSSLVVACTVTWSMVGRSDVVNIDPRTLLLNMRVVGVAKD